MTVGASVRTAEGAGSEPLISEKQAAYLGANVHRYRRQIPGWEALLTRLEAETAQEARA